MKENLNKLRINFEGKYIHKEIIVNIEEVVKSIDEKEGCHLVGNFHVKKVDKLNLGTWQFSHKFTCLNEHNIGTVFFQGDRIL